MEPAFKGRLCEPNNKELIEQILEKAHRSRYTVDLSSTKMYHNHKQAYWWNEMKKQIASYVKQYDTSQLV